MKKRLTPKQKARARFLMDKRKAKRAAKAAPRKALAQWSVAVRASGKCAVCGATEYLNAHHILPKERYKEFKFELINGICLCPTHHKYGKFSAHRNMLWFARWLRLNRPEQYVWAIQNLGNDAPL